MPLTSEKQESNQIIFREITVKNWLKKKKACPPKKSGFYLKLCKVFRGLALRNSTYRAATSAGTAVNTSVRVDLVLAVALSDCAYRALASAGTAADARTRNNICHWKSTSY